MNDNLLNQSLNMSSAGFKWLHHQEIPTDQSSQSILEQSE
jgi:hypothetical protein